MAEQDRVAPGSARRLTYEIEEAGIPKKKKKKERLRRNRYPRVCGDQREAKQRGVDCDPARQSASQRTCSGERRGD